MREKLNFLAKFASLRKIRGFGILFDSEVSRIKEVQGFQCLVVYFQADSAL
jgi:hypothetical protein